MPSFTTHESTFMEALTDNQSIGVWLPGEVFDTQTIRDTSSSIPTSQKKIVKKRRFLFVSAAIVK